MTTLKTKRLILRPWKEEDLEAFARLNADPRVMEYFPSIITKVESDSLAHRIQSKIEERGWGFWAVSVPEISEFIGFIGLNPVEKSTFSAHFTPAVEMGWRLAYDYWGKGYAQEGALVCLKFAFEELHLNEIVAFTAVTNQRSQKVMEKIGMHHNPKDDFDHPKVLTGPLKRHVLYRIKLEQWQP